MLKPALPLLVLLLAAATSAQAQPGGGRPSGGPSNRAAVHAPKPPKPVDRIEIVGVIKAIDLGAGRVTIAYEAVPELSWPHGIMPFTVYRADLLKTLSVGQKVRFKLDGQQISEIGPY